MNDLAFYVQKHADEQCAVLREALERQQEERWIRFEASDQYARYVREYGPPVRRRVPQ
jgi:hypothetical protein